MIAIPAFFFFLSQFTPEPKFSEQVIDDQISIGYGLAIGDVDGDRKPDILLADKKQFVWYRNGDWKRFVMVENLTEFDNVCIAARDIDGDGKVEVAVGAQWNPGETFDTLKSGSVHYLVRPLDLTKRWATIELPHEPTIHRMKWVKIGEKQYQLAVVPLHGRGNRNGEGKGVRIYGYEKPLDINQPWKRILIDSSMHLTHNFELKNQGPDSEVIYVAGKEGVNVFMYLLSGNWHKVNLSPSPTKKSTGEVRTLKTSAGSGIVGISPMHGNELMVHEIDTSYLITNDLNQGHALVAGDFLASGSDQIIIGWREPNKENKVGIKMFVENKLQEGSWIGHWIDNNGMACEDLQVADLDGDGKKDIIASGRASHNLKIYWNRN